jgi:hypothetical protein
MAEKTSGGTYGTGFAGGVTPERTGKGNDGFSNVESHKATFESGPEGTVRVGREDCLGLDEVASGGRGKGR